MKFGASVLVLAAAGLVLAGCAGRKELKPWNPPPYFAPESYAEVEGVRVAYLEAGEANPAAVVFVHGFSGDIQNWWDQFEYFAKNYHVLVLDNPGHGRSARGEEVHCSIDLFARVVVGLMEQRGIERAALVGNSMGGQIAAYAAIHYPERVEKLVLSDSAGAGKLGALSLLIPFASPGAVHLFFKSMGDQYQGTDPKDQARNAFALSFRGTVEERPYMKALSQSIKSVARTPLREDLHHISAPTLLIWGDDDTLVKPETMDVFASQIPETARYLVHEGGHTPPMQKPVEFNCAVDNFILGEDLEPCHQRE
ncbi:MAG: hypothetical protein A2V67_07110 [Deltaproteobacteria bacterium RBG_13_61_14]|nr:MAG: hypothetical protein A2V67_07110 [Deltaproteobacteria bacterium RBG_13_61_14]